jgi:hypothetical protein
MKERKGSLVKEMSGSVERSRTKGKGKKDGNYVRKKWK